MAATKTAKKTNKKLDFKYGFETIKSTSKNINDFALSTTSEAIDVAVKTTSLWQGVAEKAVKGGLKLARKQQDITFDALEVVKSQFSESRNRFSKLIKNK